MTFNTEETGNWMPSTQQVRSHYVFDQGNQWNPERGEAFDRWLAAHNAEVRAGVVAEEPERPLPTRANTKPGCGGCATTAAGRELMTDKKGKRMKKIIGVVIAALFMIGVPVTAHAAGSDGPTPYTVTAEGVQLPNGSTFQDNGHVNIRTNQGDRGIHFESLNNQPSGQWIGKNFLPWSAFGLDANTVCVKWVQVAEYNEHFGEGGQVPVGKGCTVTPPPPVFSSYEVCATWEVVAGNELWPQTLVSRDCGYVPAQRCDAYTIQFDKYWIRDEADKAYWESLTGLNSSADDQSLEPHDYYVKVIDAKDCTPVIPAQPANLVVESEWVTGSYECGDTTVHISREVTVTAYVWNGTDWVLGESVTTSQTDERNLTPEEIDALDCAVVVPPVEEPPVIVDSPATEPVAKAVTTEAEDTEVLATTGGEVSTGALIAAGLLGIGALLLFALNRMKRKDRDE